MAQLKDLLITGPSLFNGDVVFSKIPTYNNITFALSSEIAYKNEGIYFVVGNTTGTAGNWTGTSDRITEYYDGLVINYKVGIAGHSDGTTLNINNLGAKACYMRGTTKVTTQYDIGTMVVLSYNASKNAFYTTDADDNNYAKTRQYLTTTNQTYPLLFAYEPTSNPPSSYDTNYTRLNSNIYANPSSGTLMATAFAKVGSSNSYVLLGDGSHKAITDFAMANGYLPLTGSSLTSASQNMTGAIMFNNCDGIKINSHNTDLKIWEVYGNSGKYESSFGFDLLYKGTNSANDNSLILYAHNQSGAHKPVYTIKQDGTASWNETVDFKKQPTTTYNGSVQKLATEDYVAAATNAAVVLRGTLGTTADGGTIQALPAATSATLGDAYKVISANTYGTIKAKVGDLLICYSPTSTTYAWLLIPAGDDIEDTWRKIQIDSKDYLGNGTSTKPLNLVGGTNISLVTDGNGKVTINAAHPDYVFTDGVDSFSVSSKASGFSDTVNITNRKIMSLDSGTDETKATHRKSKYIATDIPCGITYDFKYLDGISVSSQSNGPTGTYFGVMNWRSYGSADDYSGGPTLQLAYDMSGNLWKRIHKTDRTNKVFDWYNWVRLATTADIPTVNNSKITINAGDGLIISEGIDNFTLNQKTAETIKLAVNTGTGITIANDKVTLSASGVTEGKYGQESAVNLNYGDAFTVPVVTVDQYGRVTEANEYTLTLPAADNTDTKNTAGSNTSSNTLYLIGATTQDNYAVTYSSNGLTVKEGALTANEYNISTNATIKYDSSAKCIRFIIN